MRRISIFVLALAVGAMAGAQAEARPAHHRHGARVVHAATPEITVRKRSFLDPGNVVPVGSENHYMDEGTIYIHTPGGPTYRREEFGDGLLPQPGELPGYSRYQPW
jgi:hypothetical protein